MAKGYQKKKDTMADAVATSAESKRLEIALMVCCLFGVLLVFASLFLMTWRVEVIGTTGGGTGIGIDTYFHSALNWDASYWGLFHVKRRRRQAFQFLVRNTCQFGAGWGITAIGTPYGQMQYDHYFIRCRYLQRVLSMSYAVMIFGIIEFVAVLLALIIGCQNKRKKFGGVVFGLLMFSGLVGLLISTVYAFVTSASFWKILETSYYPYPALGSAWYLNFFGSLLVAACAALFGVLVIPQAMTYDKEAEELAAQERRLEKAFAAPGKPPKSKSKKKGAPPNNQAPVGWSPYGSVVGVPVQPQAWGVEEVPPIPEHNSGQPVPPQALNIAAFGLPPQPQEDVIVGFRNF